VDVRNYPMFQNHLLLFENDLLHVLNVYEVQTNYLSDCRVIQTINDHEVETEIIE